MKCHNLLLVQGPLARSKAQYCVVTSQRSAQKAGLPVRLMDIKAAHEQQTALPLAHSFKCHSLLLNQSPVAETKAQLEQC